MTVGLSDRLREDSPRGPRLRLVSPSPCSSSAALLAFASIPHHRSQWVCISPRRTLSANLVEFCPVEPFATLSIVRGYRDPGACRDGAAPLLKPVVASAGDVVEVSARGISVNGALLPNTAPLTRDTKGRHLEAWPSGRYVVAPGTIWVASSYHPRSFDSRYFGPLSTAAIRHRLKAFLTL